MTSPGYIKHVSFDDLAPTLIDDQVDIYKHSGKPVGFNDQFVHIPPQLNPLYHSDSKEDVNPPKLDMFTQDQSSARRKSHDERKLEMMLQFMSPHDALKHSLSNQEVVDRSRSNSPMALPRATHRLPPPPRVPSIKQLNKRVDECWDITDYDVSNMGWQTEKNLTRETEKNTQSNSGSSSGYTQAAFANLNELEDRLDPNSDKTPAKETKNDRKKSFAGMSDQELAKLENFYESQSRSTISPTIENFDFKEQDPFFVDSFQKKGHGPIIDPLAAIYPSRPVVDHRAISVTIENKKYDKYVEDFNTRTGSRKPEESLAAIRNVNCYISGRRYTWSSADWYVENCAQDGDHLAIVTPIPFFEREVEASDYAISRRHLVESHSDYGSSDDHDKELGRVSTSSSDYNALGPAAKGLRIKAIHEDAKKACLRILNYYASRLEGKIVKITVEMIKCDSADFAITKAAALYKPDIQIVSTVSTNLQIKFKNGKVKLPFFVMRHYAMPTAVLPYEFMDPKLLGEEATTDKPAEKRDIPRGDERLAMIDNIILKTLRNPFAAETSTKKSNSDDESEVDSLNGYFPMSPEQKRKYEMFEKTGYLRCPPTRQNAYMTSADPNTAFLDQPSSYSAGSRRNSRIQFDDGMYKVKSLIDDSSDEEDRRKSRDTSIRKTKSMGPISKSKTPTLSPTTSISKHHRRHLHPTGTKSADNATPASESTNKKGKSKEKKSLGSFFRKVFK